ncbi:uncharacterized protein [Phyllobates terribilis]|uniref:uncharacterized protein n=1 Tax=Phyllobates terribilis TaxID=111132 RepID=UPI003CCB25EC
MDIQKPDMGGDMTDIRETDILGDVGGDVSDVGGADVQEPLKILENSEITQAQLQIKMRKNLLKLYKIMPKYDVKIHACRNLETFESFSDKFDLSNEERNQLFKMWIPVTFSRRLNLMPCENDSPNGWENDSDRLRYLIYCVTKDFPNIEDLQKLRIGRKECTYTFMSIFERMYKNGKLQQMISTFVQKFKFLNPVFQVIASQKFSLFKCAQLLDSVRKHENREKKINQAKFIKPEKVKSYQKPISNSPRLSHPHNEIYQMRRRFHICYKPYQTIQKSISPPKELKIQSCDFSLETKMAEIDGQGQVRRPAESDVMECGQKNRQFS